MQVHVYVVVKTQFKREIGSPIQNNHDQPDPRDSRALIFCFSTQNLPIKW